MLKPDGGRLIIRHAGGYGDSILLLRYVPVLQAQGIDVALVVPVELQRLMQQVAPLASIHHIGRHDVFCSIFDLDQMLDDVPDQPYLKEEPELREWWRDQLNGETRRMVGIAWSTRDAHRTAPLDAFVRAFDPGVALISLQANERERAAAHGVLAPEYEDFADVAALAACMDQIVCIDTAALHVAGAIGHPDVSAVVPHISSWMWRHPLTAFYPNVKFCRQTEPNNWDSALAQLTH